MGLREYMLQLAMRDTYFLPEFSILVSRARTLIEQYVIGQSFTGSPNPATIDKTRNEILKYLGEIVASESARFPSVQGRGLQDFFEDFTRAVRASFKDIRDLKVKADTEMNEAKEDDVRTVIVSPFIEWAIETVSNLPMNPKSWKDVAISVMLLTGRRQSEVLSSGIFTYVDESHVIFEGQLKRHKDELVEATEIPVLGYMGQEVCNALNWLTQHGKRTIPTERTYDGLQQAAKASHNRSSRYIAEAMVNLSQLVQITNGKSWVIKTESPSAPSENLFKGHLCRQLYAQICAACFHNQKDSKVRSYIAEILIENRKASLKYDRDIELDVSDIQKVKELCGTLTD